MKNVVRKYRELHERAVRLALSPNQTAQEKKALAHICERMQECKAFASKHVGCYSLQNTGRY